MSSKYQRLIRATWFAALVALAGCVTTNQPQMTNCSVTIRSEPKGALVLASSSNTVQEAEAVVLGNTPLRRFMRIQNEGMPLLISARGYQEWRGSVSPANPTVSARLRRMPRNAKSEKRLQGVKILPVRVGAHVIGQARRILDSNPESARYRSLFLDTFHSTIGEQAPKYGAEHEMTAAQYEAVWNVVEERLKKHCFERIPYLPEPLQMDLGPLGLERQQSEDKYLLLLRAEAYYVSGGKRFARIAAPLILTAAGAAIGANNPVASHTSGMTTTTTYVFPVFGVGPQEDTIVIQKVLIHPGTGHIEWCGQLVARAYYRKPDAVRQLARQAAQLVPDAFLK